MPRNDAETSVGEVDMLVGSVFDKRFRIEERLATGGFGAIYRATHIKSGHPVALKVLLPSLAQDLGVVARFRREGDTLTALRCPHTINAYELGQAADRRLFITMELLHGESLFERYQANGPFEWKRMARIARQVCESLAEAHAAGIVHRDLKPTNIHLETHGDDSDFVKVLDFGIAKILRGSDFDAADITNAGQMIGTLDYMSPEQMVGGKVTGQSDIYTLGIVMYEMIAGTTPFPESQTASQALAAVMKTTPEPLYLRAPVPEELDRIVMRCLERDTKVRYQTVEELTADLDRVLAGHADRARNVTTKPVERIDEATQFTPPPARLVAESRRVAPDFEATQLTPIPEQLLRDSRADWNAEATTTSVPTAELLAQARRARRESAEQTTFTPPPQHVLAELRGDETDEHDNVTKVARVADIAASLSRSAEPDGTTALPRNRTSTDDNEKVTKVTSLADLVAATRGPGEPPPRPSDADPTLPRTMPASRSEDSGVGAITPTFPRQPASKTQPPPSTLTPPRTLTPPQVAVPRTLSPQQPLVKNPPPPGSIATPAPGSLPYLQAVPSPSTHGGPPPAYPPPAFDAFSTPFPLPPPQPAARTFEMSKMAQREAMIRRVIWIVAFVLAAVLGIVLATQL